MVRGAFITIEGGEGVGKSTSLAAVEDSLRRLGRDVTVTREPGGTPLGERVRSMILDGDSSITPMSEALLMFAARAEHLAAVIGPALEAGRWVLCDRFTDATMAYQGGGRGMRRPFLELLRDEVQGDLRPDLTILLDAPVAVGLDRIRSREFDHFERAGESFLERVRRAYLDIAGREPERVRVIDADRPVEQVNSSIVATVNAFAAEFTEAVAKE